MELAQPITIHWDLPEEKSDHLLQKTLAEILACRPLMLQLRDPSPRLEEATVSLLKSLAGSPVAVSLSIPPRALDEEALALLSGLRLKEVLLMAQQLEPLRAFFGKYGAAAIQGTACGVSFLVTQANWQELPELVTWRRGEGIGRLVLPMQRLYQFEPPFFLNPRQQSSLAGALGHIGGVDGVEITIHDPFLWRAFHPGVPFPQGGCQAANTMMAIAPDGAVYPCPTLPVPLGNLAHTSLKEIVGSPAKKQFRRALLQNPGECAGCRELPDCRGGCRGRGYLGEGKLEGADPACGSPR